MHREAILSRMFEHLVEHMSKEELRHFLEKSKADEKFVIAVGDLMNSKQVCPTRHTPHPPPPTPHTPHPHRYTRTHCYAHNTHCLSGTYAVHSHC